MRITTKMLNESARKAGLPINNTSLLNYLNGNSDNTLRDALNKSETSATKTKYEKLEKAADQLSDAASAFGGTGEKSIFSKVQESGDCQDIYNAAEKFVGKYNSTLSALKNTPSTMNDFYKQMLQEAVSENKNALEAIGITMAKDGSLNIDNNKMKAADVDTLEKALGNTTGFTQKLAFVAGRISDNAQVNQSSMSNQYSSTGSLSSILEGKYDLFG